MGVKLRSQVDAPVELVIAIIILLASLSIAILVMSQTSKEQCYSELKGEMQKIQIVMQDLALQSPPSVRKVFIALPRCGDIKVEAIRFVSYSEPDLCRKCPGHYDGCWMIEMTYKVRSDNPDGVYYAIENNGKSYDVCVDMSSDIKLQQSNDNTCVEMSNTPCSKADEADCREDRSNIPKEKFDPDEVNSPARYQTFGTDQNTYELTLSKSSATCSSGICGAINICAKTPSRN